MFTLMKDIYPKSKCEEIINGWTRYLDDCWVIWKYTYGDFEVFKQLLSNLHDSIQFTISQSNHSLNFLDVLVYKNISKGSIETDIYNKPTDSFNYVPFTSSHPRHILRNIPFVLAHRIERIVSDENNKRKRFQELEDRLINLSYPMELIKNSIHRAKENTCTMNKGPKTDNNDEIIPFVHTYNPNNPSIFHNIIHPVVNTLKSFGSFANCQFKSCMRQPKSLLSILRKNKRIQIKGVTKCNQSRCKCCNHIEVGDTTSFKSKEFCIRSNLTCGSSNLIYKLTLGCNDYYIGQSGDTLRHRVTVHRQQIQEAKYSYLPVSKHIRNCADSMDIKFSITPFYKMPLGSTRVDREHKEAIFINIYEPPLNAIRTL